MEERLFLRGICVQEPLPQKEYWARLPAVRRIAEQGGLTFRKSVTILVGENGVGKSTLLEAVASVLGFNAEGGSRNFRFSTRNTTSRLQEYLTPIRGSRFAQDGFFLRAETFYNAASYLDEAGESHNYGGSLHECSHGESFLALVENRFWGNGLYLLDEPEAALSPMRQLRLLAELHSLAQDGSQLLICTHSPILMSMPDAELLYLTQDGIQTMDYRQTEHFQLMKQFVNAPEQMLHYLLEET